MAWQCGLIQHWIGTILRGPSPWSKAEDVRFAEAVDQLVEEIRRELGPGYEVINEHCPVY